MKRIIFILLAVIGLCGIAQAQVGVGYYRSGYGSVQKTQDVGPLTRNHNIYYYHGKPMKRAEMVQLLNDNCKEAYDYYRKQQKIEKAGWGLFGAGIVMTLGLGVPMTIIGSNNQEVAYKNWYNHPESRGGYSNYYETPAYKSAEATWDAGLGFVCIGPITSVLVGVPMIIAGNVQKKNAHKVYNTWCGYKELEQETSSRENNSVELRLQSSSNGLGLALSF